MSTIKVNKIENTATADGGIAIDATGHVQIDGVQLPTAGALSNRNLIDNGDHRIDQRNGGSAVTGSGDFPVDRFNLSEAGNGAFSAQRVADAPTGFQFSTKVTTTTADTSITGTERLLYITRLEGQNTAFLEFGTANAKTITLSFYVKSSVTGTFSGAIQNGASDRSYPYNYTINTADTWEYKTVTITGDTTGTWATDNTKSHQVIWSLGNSSDRAATVNAWGAGQMWGSTTGTANTLGTLNATWFITGVQLEVGEKATPFEHKAFSEELQRCKRYYQETEIGYSEIAHSRTSGILVYPKTLPVEMRASPSISAPSGFNGGGWARQDGVDITSVSHNGYDGITKTRFGVKVNGTGTAGESCFQHGSSQANAECSAEL